MTFNIRKAIRSKAKLRIGLSGPSGSGKTYSALLLARGLASAWDKILLIDTENGSGDLYSDLGEYNIITLQEPFSPERYIQAIEAGVQAGMEVVIIDSASHEWDGKGGCLEINEAIARAKYRGNTWSAWNETTPRHQKFINAIVTAGCHVITTARSKTDTIQTEDKKIKKVGMKEIQREGFEYELTVNFTLDRDGNMAIASKDRTGLFIKRDPFVVSEKIGQELLAWNESGVEPVAPVAPAPKNTETIVDPEATIENEKIAALRAKKRALMGYLERLGISTTTREKIAHGVQLFTNMTLADENLDEIIAKLAVVVGEAEKPTPAPDNVESDPLDDFGRCEHCGAEAGKKHKKTCRLAKVEALPEEDDTY